MRCCKKLNSGLYAESEAKCIFYNKDNLITAKEGRDLHPMPRQACNNTGLRCLRFAGSPGSGRPGAGPYACFTITPCPPPDRDPPVGPLGAPASRWPRWASLEAHTHSIIPGAWREACWECGVADPVQDPRRHFVLCRNLRSSPLKKQRSIHVFVGWKAGWYVWSVVERDGESLLNHLGPRVTDLCLPRFRNDIVA